LNSEVYLDNSATTRPYDEVLLYMNHIAAEVYGNPSSLHLKGIEAERHVKKAREVIAGTLSAESENIFFTSGGTESNNLAISGYLRANAKKGKHLITTKTEHPSVLEVFKHLESSGYSVDYLDVNREGLVDAGRLEGLIRPETALISIIYINNETGAIQPLEDIIPIRNRKNPGAVLHVDAVQAYGKIDINLLNLKIDLLTISSHKIHGPKGVGALYVRKGIKIFPLVYGGGQESGLRSGTENVQGICGFGKAAEICFANLKDTTKKVEILKKTLEDGIRSTVKNAVIISPAGSSPYILNVSFPGIKAEVLLHHLEQHNIFVSTGAACHSRQSTGSYVLKAMGFEERVVQGAVRFSFSSFNTVEQIRYTVETLSSVLKEIETY
jgi:cysteine desulfurase